MSEHRQNWEHSGTPTQEDVHRQNWEHTGWELTKSMYSTSDVRKLKAERDELLEKANALLSIQSLPNATIMSDAQWDALSDLAQAVSKIEARQKFAHTNSSQEQA